MTEDTDRCTATTRRKVRCRRLAVRWKPDAGEDPRVCGGHMDDQQRAALKEAERREWAAIISALPAPQRAAVARRNRIFASGQPACWSWPDTAPTEEDCRRQQYARLKEEADEYGHSAETLDRLWQLERAVPVSGHTLLSMWQDGRCAVCETTGLELVTDHDHATGLVRGLLCRSCNTREGFSYAPGEGRDVYVAYRERPPTAILGLEIRYLDPYTGEYAQPAAPPADPWEGALSFGL